MTAPAITCACGCGRTGPHHGRGLLSACYRRAMRAGRLPDYPSARDYDTQVALAIRAHEASIRVTEARIEDYVFLRETGADRAEARDRLGITDRTVTRYHRVLRAEGRRDRWLYDLAPHNLARVNPAHEEQIR